ncbi:MAG: tetratricopeptide repeat protein [Planctomycetota bacterium]
MGETRCRGIRRGRVGAGGAGAGRLVRWLVPLLLPIACAAPPAPSIAARLAAVPPPSRADPAVLLWDGWHPLAAEGDLRAPLVVAHDLAAEGEVEAALDYLEALGAAHPGESALLEARAVLEARLGYPRTAERHFAEALSAAPERPELWYALGRVRLALDLFAAAREALRRAVELGATGSLVPRDLARAERALGRPAAAATAYDAALARAGDSRIELLVEAATLALVDPALEEAARAHLDEAAALDPRAAPPWHVRGLLAEARGDLPAAVFAYEAALARDPRHLGALTSLAFLAQRCGDRDRAVLAARRALELEMDPARRARLAGLLDAPPGAAAGPE